MKRALDLVSGEASRLPVVAVIVFWFYSCTRFFGGRISFSPPCLDRLFASVPSTIAPILEARSQQLELLKAIQERQKVSVTLV